MVEFYRHLGLFESWAATFSVRPVLIPGSMIAVDGSDSL